MHFKESAVKLIDELDSLVVTLHEDRKESVKDLSLSRLYTTVGHVQYQFDFSARRSGVRYDTSKLWRVSRNGLRRYSINS